MVAIFLDIDGVLNSDRTTTKTPGGCVGISDPLCKRLKKIIDTVREEVNEDAQVILTSSWKYLDPKDEDYTYMLRKLKKVDAEPEGITVEPNNNSLKRGIGILAYLEENKKITNYVILDDYMFDMADVLAQHLVLTDERIGLTDRDVSIAVDILKGKLLPPDYYRNINKERGYYR